MSFNESMEQIKENDWNIDVETVRGKKYRGELKWWTNYEVCLGFNKDEERIFFKANLIYVSPVKD